MSQDLIIYKPGDTDDTPEQHEPLGDLDAVTTTFNEAFAALIWASPTEAALSPEGSFRLALVEEAGTVDQVHIQGGLNHIRQLAALCKREDWRIADTEKSEDVDLDDPHKWFEERHQQSRQ
jgi:hypothetical protein